MKKILLIISIALFANIFQIYAQSGRVVTGTILDEQGVGLPGASVVEKGATNNGVISDMNGKFSIKMTSNAKQLVVTFVGYSSQSVTLGTGSNYEIKLSPDVTVLEETVIVGYGTQKKASLVGAISQVNASDLQKASTPNLTNSLSGRIAGVITVMGSGKPGADDSKIYIRGMATTNSTSPLVLVDGVERDWNEIDPTDVETLSVLKDASATAVFGVRGANGVIMITTKRGEKGKPVFNITSRTTIQSPISIPNYLDSYNYATLMNEALQNDGNAPIYTASDLQHYKTGDSPYTHPNNDLYKDFMKKASLQENINLSARGGTDFLSYYISASILHQEGLYKKFNNDMYNTNSNYDRYNFRSNLDFNVSKTTKLGIDLTARLETRMQPNFDKDIFDKLRRLPPNFQPYINPNGSMGGNGDETRLQPYAELSNYGNRSNNTNVMEGTFKFDQKLDVVAKGLSFNALAGFNSSFQSYLNINEKPETWKYDRFGQYTLGQVRSDLGYSSGKGMANSGGSGTTRRQMTAQAALNYTRAFAKDHDVSAMVLYQRIQNWSNFDIPTGYLGYVGRVSYGYKRRYLLEADAGYNGSMQFASNHRYGFFPAVSAGWVISDENFWKNNITFINFLKFRGSYGEVGNDKIGDYKYLYVQKYVMRGSGDGKSIKWGESGNTDERGIYEGAPGNSNVTWERAKKENIGFDARLFDSKLSITADLFKEHRVDILALPYSIPLVLGYNNPNNGDQGLPPQNLGIVDNHGLDMEVGYNGHIKDFNYFFKGNFTYAANKIVKMDEEGKKYDWSKKLGKPIGQHFGLVDIGLYQKSDFNTDASGNLILENGYPVLKPDVPVPTFGVVYPGDCKYKDLDGNRVIDNNDIRDIGKGSVPQYTYGITIGGSYKNFDLSILIQGSGNASLYLHDDAAWEFNAGGKVMVEHLGRYIADDPSTWNTATYPLLHAALDPNNQQSTTRWTHPTDYIRLKNVELGYTIPKAKSQKIGISQLRLFVSGNNLITLSQMKNWDPESPSEIGDSYPQLRLWNGGVSINF